MDLEPHDTVKDNLAKLNSRVLSNGQDYTILSKRERGLITAILALLGLCSSIGLSIYWVCLTEMQHAFHVSEEKINLTITVYLIFQSLATAVVAKYSDQLGRRPILLACVLGGTLANVGIALCNTYWLLLLMRCFQSMFLSPLYSLIISVTGDLATGRDRGSLTSLLGGFSIMGQAFAPFVGSLIDTRWHWRAIFWFCAIFDGLSFALAFCLLPETNRSFVGNMSHTPDRLINKAPILLAYRSRLCDTEGENVERRKTLHKNPFHAFHVLKDPEVVPLMLPAALANAAWTSAQTSLTTALATEYHYSTLKIGLCFIGPGSFVVLGTFLAGYLLDRAYHKDKMKYAATDLKEPFNLIKSRMRVATIPLLICAAATFCYGWILKYHESVAAVIVLAVFMAGGNTFPIDSSLTLMVDLYPQEPGSASSMVNFFRCGLSAIMTSVLSRMNAAMTIGGTYTLFGGLLVFGALLTELIDYKSLDIMRMRQKRLNGT